jgi:hypothetical protein
MRCFESARGMFVDVCRGHSRRVRRAATTLRPSTVPRILPPPQASPRLLRNITGIQGRVENESCTTRRVEDLPHEHWQVTLLRYLYTATVYFLQPRILAFVLSQGIFCCEKLL